MRHWLLCDFHIHTSISDGSLSVREVVDLYGEHGFDVISVTDHIVDSFTLEERRKRGEEPHAVLEENFQEYLKTLWKEAGRAWRRYRMLLIPGAELTNNLGKYHILVIDLKEYIDPELPVEEIIERVREQNAVAVAAHPDKKKRDPEHFSWYLWENQHRFRGMFDAWEVANRDDVFNSVGVKKYNYIANSDFHEHEHLYSWKTLIRADKNTEAVKEAIRRNTEIAIWLMRRM